MKLEEAYRTAMRRLEIVYRLVDIGLIAVRTSSVEFTHVLRTTRHDMPESFEWQKSGSSDGSWTVLVRVYLGLTSWWPMNAAKGLGRHNDPLPPELGMHMLHDNLFCENRAKQGVSTSFGLIFAST